MSKTPEPAADGCDFCGKNGGHEAGCPVPSKGDAVCNPGICAGCTFKPKCKKKWGEQ